ncbi:hypothetical protein ACT17_22905 [Mycolicibacterium conceptionense]|uniref:Uncharacterized protein n=1 Tax=Mycolicibacterium conceptionense TaxID=451644 RepID=A0A0J8U345_9MYCO|nr:hypothetical protein [Mycolicibacterium conceptionense]KMV15946.1 hypothetical protein ACT17_22905 [Mycolicibacterium conceptionense]
MTSNHFFVDTDGFPSWTGSYWRIKLDGDQVVAKEIAGDNPVPADVAAETMRSIVTEILAGTDQYDVELTTLVLAAEQYRKDN